jgi:small subunit ribosomal protein S20
VKTYFRRMEAAVAGGDPEAADTALRELSSRIDRAVRSGAFHRNTGARKKARATRLRASLD